MPSNLKDFRYDEVKRSLTVSKKYRCVRSSSMKNILMQSSILWNTVLIYPTWKISITQTNTPVRKMVKLNWRHSKACVNVSKIRNGKVLLIELSFSTKNVIKSLYPMDIYWIFLLQLQDLYKIITIHPVDDCGKYTINLPIDFRNLSFWSRIRRSMQQIKTLRLSHRWPCHTT